MILTIDTTIILVTKATTESSKVVKTELESTHEPVISSEENSSLDVGALPGPPNNEIDISPDGLSELTFGQLLVLFSKIDQAKKQGEKVFCKLYFI